jgi:cyclopropane-fatty-acyl-phospholipid synthase
MVFQVFLKRFIRVGSVTMIDPKGRATQFGNGASPRVAIRVHTTAASRRMALNPRLAIGEAFMEGQLTIEDGTLYDFIDLCCINQELDPPALLKLLDRFDFVWRRVRQLNNELRSRHNVAHHYDLSARLYDLFLDDDRQYSCAYFAEPGLSLEEAQSAKKRHLAAKLLLKSGAQVLDIGCGWGGLALSLAREAEIDVLGITLSEEQLKVARERAKAAGLDHRVRFELIDYRKLSGQFDRIVSVGMFEHVGAPQYPTFFAKVRDLLKPDGVAVLHSIARSEGPGTTNAWFRKYIFPGGYSPALSEVVPHIEQAGLWATDIEILRLHYAETLAEWRRRFMANRDEVKALYDERFCRMWEFYLVGAELSFRRQGHMNIQIQMAKDINAVPLTRDYIYEFEHRPARKPALVR